MKSEVSLNKLIGSISWLSHHWHPLNLSMHLTPMISSMLCLSTSRVEGHTINFRILHLTFMGCFLVFGKKLCNVAERAQPETLGK